LPLGFPPALPCPGLSPGLSAAGLAIAGPPIGLDCSASFPLPLSPCGAIELVYEVPRKTLSAVDATYNLTTNKRLLGYDTARERKQGVVEKHATRSPVVPCVSVFGSLSRMMPASREDSAMVSDCGACFDVFSSLSRRVCSVEGARSPLTDAFSHFHFYLAARHACHCYTSQPF